MACSKDTDITVLDATNALTKQIQLSSNKQKIELRNTSDSSLDCDISILNTFIWIGAGTDAGTIQFKDEQTRENCEIRLSDSMAGNFLNFNTSGAALDIIGSDDLRLGRTVSYEVSLENGVNIKYDSTAEKIIVRL